METSDKLMCYDKVFSVDTRKGVLIEVSPKRAPQWFTDKACEARAVVSF